MRVLVACEFSGKVRDAFIEKGHHAISCDFLPGEGKHRENHIQTNALGLAMSIQKWDLMIAHPPCTYLASSGLHWNARTPGRCIKTRDAIIFAELLWKSEIPRICIENPIGCLPTHSNLMKYSQIIEPWQFGHETTKATCLWLKNLPDLIPTNIVSKGNRKIYASGKSSPEWHAKTGGGSGKERSITYQGIADAMAEQWGTV